MYRACRLITWPWAELLTGRARRFEVLGIEKDSVRDGVRAYEIFKKLAAEHPHRPDYRHELAGAVHNVARVPMSDSTPASYRQNIATMEKAYRDAVSQQERLVAEFPAVLEHHQRLATSLNTLATWLCDKPASALLPEETRPLAGRIDPTPQRSEAIWTRLAPDTPRSSTTRTGWPGATSGTDRAGEDGQAGRGRAAVPPGHCRTRAAREDVPGIIRHHVFLGALNTIWV